MHPIRSLWDMLKLQLLEASDGEVKKILVQDGQPVEFGQSLILLK